MGKMESPRDDRVAYRAIRAALQQSSEASYDDVRSVALKLYKGINTPFSLSLAKCLAQGNIAAIANASVVPETYTSVDDFYVDYCAANFLRKYEDLHELGVSPIDREQAALTTFFESEAQCLNTNAYFSSLFVSISPTPEYRNIICEIQGFIKRLLGKCPRVEDIGVRFGPGSTSACKGERLTIADKLIAFPECTLDAAPFVRELLKGSPIWSNLIDTIHPKAFYGTRSVVDGFGNEVRLLGQLAPRLVRGNKFTTVPKTAKTHRGICIEPHCNVVAQLGIGSILASKLERAGIGKDTQQAINKRYAREASLVGDFSTIDLSAASDTIAYEVVKLLLPWDWFELLSSVRSPETYVDGKWIENEKFSSMGNGYTFELESIIFYAISRIICDRAGYSNWAVNVYGDDIIVPSGCFQKLLDALSYFGFTANLTKSFSRTGFNESCGGDYLRGEDVRPYFLKESPNDALSWFTVVNGIRRMACKHMPNGELDPRFLGAWLRAIAHIPKPLRFHGPPADGDGWIHTEDRSRWTARRRFGVLYVRSLCAKPISVPLTRYCGETVLAAVLYGHSGDGFPLRGKYQQRSRWATTVR